MPQNGYPRLPNCGRLLVPVSEGCYRVHNANIQGIHVKIQPLFPGEAVLLFEPGGRHFGGVCNTDGWPIAFAVPNDSILAYGLGLLFLVRERLSIVPSRLEGSLPVYFCRYTSHYVAWSRTYDPRPFRQRL